MPSEEVNKERFTYYHNKEADVVTRCELSSKFKDMVELAVRECPDNRERSIGMRKLEEALMWLNASVTRFSVRSQIKKV